MNQSNPTKGFAVFQVVLWFTVTASLALVSTFALTRYLDSVYFEDDVEMAREFTEIIDEHPILSNEFYRAHDIRKFLMYHSGKTYDFEAKTSNAGFFYITSQNKVIAATFDEIPNIVTELNGNASRLLDDSEEPKTFSSPEELFGNGVILLSTSGSLVAKTVDTLSKLPETPYLKDAYQKQYRELRRPLNNYINGCSPYIDLLKDLMDAFHPEKTLFVNNIDWSTAAKEGNEITRILFAQGISNIPTYDLGLVTTIQEVTLPMTVKTIEEGAFTNLLSVTLDKIIITSSSTVRILEGAVDEGIDILHGDFIEITLDEIEDYSASVDFSVDALGTFKVDFSDLEIRSIVTGYRVVRIGAKYILYIFGDEGLIGYAEGILSYDE